MAIHANKTTEMNIKKLMTFQIKSLYIHIHYWMLNEYAFNASSIENRLKSSDLL